jgi:hypothetical protein
MFWENFFANFLSDFIVGFVIAILAKNWYENQANPRPVLAVNENENEYSISKVHAKAGFTLTLEILNKGRKAWKNEEGYFHIFINKNISPELRNGVYPIVPQDNSEYFKIHAPNPGPCLMDRFKEIEEISCKLHEDGIDESTIYYFFSTEFGVIPRNVKTDDMTSYGKVVIKFTDENENTGGNTNDSTNANSLQIRSSSSTS